MRYKVRGLYRSEGLKSRLEILLSSATDIYFVSANILTGNVLICYNPECNVRRIRTDLEQIATDFVREVSADSEALTYAPPKITKGLKDSGRKTDGLQLAGLEKYKSKPWHLMDPKLVLADVNSSISKGLSSQGVEINREKYGSIYCP